MSSNIKYIFFGLLMGCVGTFSITYYLINDLRHQAFNDIVQEREYMSNSYKSLFEKLTVDEQVEWLNNRSKKEQNVLCKYNEMACSKSE